MNKHTKEVIERLELQYGTEYVCYLHHENALQLLIATMLSAQCTDARVNIVTKDLFQKYQTVYDFAAADLKELERDIHSTGFYHNKAKNIIACCKKILSDFDGERVIYVALVPRNFRTAQLGTSCDMRCFYFYWFSDDPQPAGYHRK